MRRRTALLTLLALAAAPVRRMHATPYLARTDVQQFVDELVGDARIRSGPAERWLQRRALLGWRRTTDAARRFPSASATGSSTATATSSRLRIQAGIAFWRTHAEALSRAEQQFGVPAEIIVAIIGIETYFGRITGNFRTLDVFTTLSFDYLRRADFYRAEFVEFLLLARDQKRDPSTYRGSFAGAIGLPQFMPGSIRRWAVDFDGDGRIDLLGSPVDAIGSVANFLVGHGWQRDLPIAFEVEADEGIVDATWSRHSGADGPGGPRWPKASSAMRC